MSVINQMLRDLEQRNITVPKKNSPSEHYVDTINIVAETKTYYRWLIFFAVLTVLIIAINLNLHYANQQPVLKSFLSDKKKTEEQEDILPEIVKYTQVKTVDLTQNKEYQSVDSKKKETISAQKTAQKAIKQVLDNTNKKTKPQFDAGIQIKTKSIIKLEKNSKINLNKISKATVKPSLTKVKKQRSEKSHSELVYQARLLMKDDDNKAIQLLENNISKITPKADYYALLANLYQRKKHYTRAITLYKKALNTVPDKGEIWIGVALAYRGAGDRKNSEKAFKKALILGNISPQLKQYAAQQVK
jgi:tetratricopeptide (TPR) repeat protein